jgi:hypothetical protein
MGNEEKISFYVQGSSEEPYEVIIIKNGSNLSASCTCRAGLFGQICKHRTRILDGDDVDVVSDNKPDIDRVVSWLNGTDVEAALMALKDAEIKHDKIKKDIKKLKKDLAEAMNN